MNHNNTKTICFCILTCFAISVQSQTITTLTVHVTPSVGNRTAGVRVSLANEDYGLNYPEQVLTESGEVTFSNVLTTRNILTINGNPIGLACRTDTIEVVENMRYEAVLDEQTRQPYALRATLQHNAQNGDNTVRLVWNQEVPAIEDDFESYEDFAIHFAPWTGIDGDHAPTAQIQGAYPNAQLEQYATIFNPLTIEPSVWYEYPVLRPYSGAQYVGFITTADGTQNDDYLISPRLKIGQDFVVRFMAKAADRPNERFRVGIAANIEEGTTPTQKDFVWFNPGNYRTVDYRAWQRIEYSLADYTGQDVYICINYASEQTFMLMVDDFYVGPSDNASKPLNEYEKHVILIDGDSVGTTTDNEFITSPLPAGLHRFGVYSAYRYSHTDTLWAELYVPDANHYAALTLRLEANNGEPTDGIVALLTHDSTHTQYRQKATNGICHWQQLPLGRYTVTADKTYFLPLRTTIDLTQDTSITAVMIEQIIQPYNLKVELTHKDTVCHGLLVWNRDLGFSDSFEAYEPFAQQFENWTTLDADTGISYAISLGGVTIEMGEFGINGKTSAMIFNPYSTTPAVGVDTYFMAQDGDQYIAFFSPQGGVANDWLIAHPIEIGDNWVVRYWGKAYSAQYPETVEVMVRKDGTTTDDFVSLSKQVFADGEWAQYEVSLAEYAGSVVEVAFHYISRDMWFAQLDNVYIGPSTSTDTEGEDVGNAYYEVYIDDILSGETKDTQYDLGPLSTGTHTVAVQAVYRSGRSEKAALTFEVTATGIRYTYTNEPFSKYLHRGRLIIRRGQDYYDIIGNKL